MSVLSGIYPYENTIISIEDGRLLNQLQYDVLFGARDLRAALGELNAMDYFRSYVNAGADNYGQMLDGLMNSTFELMRAVSPDELVWRIFALYYDIHNMKLVAKERAFHRRLGRLALSCGSYSLPTVRSAAVRESDDILENRVLTEGFFMALRAKDHHDIDFILDKTYFKALKDLAGRLRIPMIDAFVTERIDLYNISVYFQSAADGAPDSFFEKAFSDQGSVPLPEWQRHFENKDLDDAAGFGLWQKYRPLWGAGSAADKARAHERLDVLIDNYLIEKTKVCKVMAFGIEPICAYFYNKLMEIKNVRIILAGKRHAARTGEIRKWIRIPYEL